MTRLAVITDVHADVHALRDALAQIDRIGVDQILCCGDLVDYGLFPEETIALLRERGVTTIRGNHDRWALHDGRDMTGWDLTASSLAWLDALPTRWWALIGDRCRVALAHARPGSDMLGIDRDTDEHELKAILRDADADVLIVGHTHVPYVRRIGRTQYVVNPGALLRDPAAGVDVMTPGTFAVIEIARGRVQLVEIRRAATGDVVIARR